MIEFKNVEKMFTKNKGLKNVNITINKENIGLVGPNGAGKTTFIELLLGLHLPRKGEVIINGVKTTDKNFNLKSIGYISANLNIPKKLSVFEYVNYIKELENNEKFNTNIEMFARVLSFDLNDASSIGSLSSGMVQKLKIILGISGDKDILIFDEPTRGLDPIAVELFEKVMEKLKAKDLTIVYCSHILDEVEKFCELGLIIKDNTIVKDVNLKEHKANLKDSFNSYYDLKEIGEF
ncbi:ATP-binding cassette domain-containing protein [Mesoplasma melaleucae]|uniref:ABC transporter ATP-binding protein n=1 Tax=Mesoplasma melaleucae TaxID=81459 RepID=A0A2K8NWB6_9MOLU|nr:ATP-binding cassette domain-containing protein [Mesoplasma melaleucae]ATZ18132.1 ABC transporter ATP-binding protein [Mesoplasma melaleucae]